MVLVDLVPEDVGTLHTIGWLREVRPELPLIVLSSDNASQTAELGRQWGARDQLAKPIQKFQLAAMLDRHIPKADHGQEFEYVEEVDENLFFVAASPVMRRLRAQIELLAKLDVPVLVLGEKGSGKETVCRLIHKRSIRSECKFLKVNCAVMSGDLLESELFGSEPVSSVGVRAGRQSQLESCNNGTLFLDEVAELPRSLQLRLSDKLQHKEFRSGPGIAVHSDVRILATMGPDLKQILAEKFHADVFYRLSAFTLRVPPLRERAEEIPLLLGYFINRTARQYDLPPRFLSVALMEQCQNYSWPGNLRELENFVKRYMLTGEASVAGQILSERNISQIAYASPAVPAIENTGGAVQWTGPQNLVRNARRQAERDVIVSALENTNWNRRVAARLLHISYRGLLYKIEEHQLARPDHYMPAAARARKKKENRPSSG